MTEPAQPLMDPKCASVCLPAQLGPELGQIELMISCSFEPEQGAILLSLGDRLAEAVTPNAVAQVCIQVFPKPEHYHHTSTKEFTQAYDAAVAASKPVYSAHLYRQLRLGFVVVETSKAVLHTLNLTDAKTAGKDFRAWQSMFPSEPFHIGQLLPHAFSVSHGTLLPPQSESSVTHRGE